MNEEVSPGYHSIIWNGADDEGNYLPSGVYFSNVVLTRNDTISYQAERTMYLISFSDSHKNGVTDSEGKFSTISRKPFINFSTVDSLEILDEDGISYGMHAFSDTTAVCITDPENDFIQFEFTIVKDKKNKISITWNPETKLVNTKNEQPMSPALNIYRDAGVSLIPRINSWVSE